MKAPIKNYAKIGTILFMSYLGLAKGDNSEGSLEGIKKICCDDYFDAIEVNWIKDPAARAKAAKLMNDSKITICYGAQPRMLTTGLNINDINEEKRLECLASLKAGIDEAYEIGASGFAFMSGKYDEATKDQAYEALLKSTKELCAYAKSKGNMPVELEIFDYDVDKKSLMGPAPYAAQFAAEIRKEYDNFGLLLDLSHLPLTREGSKEAVEAVKDYLTHVHIGNAVLPDADPSVPAYGDDHPRFGFPNSANDVDQIVEFLKALFEAGYLGEGKRPVISFEVKPQPDEDADIVIAHCKRALNEAWAKLEI